MGYYSHQSGARGVTVFYVQGQHIRQIERYLALFIFVVVVGLFTVFVTRVFTGVEQTHSFLPPIQQFMNIGTVDEKAEYKDASLLLDSEKIQKAVTQWSTTNKGQESVVIAKIDGSVLASTDPNQTFFMASIYKLYVAYVEYQNIDAGLHSKDEAFLNGWSRGRCLDEMIRNSDSPCGEKMMAEYGKDNIQAKLKTYGLTHTSMRGFTTSAHDVSLVLGRLWQGNDLSAASRTALLDSMGGQKYRDALPKGFGANKVYDKVGFRDLNEYHDVGFVLLADGQPMIISVLTNNVGPTSISKLAGGIVQAVSE